MNLETSQTNSLLSRARVESVYETLGPALRRFLMGLLKNEAAAADALQSTLGILVAKGHTADPSKIKSWLFQVAYNEAMMVRRKDKSHQKLARDSVWQVHEKSERYQTTGLDISIRKETVEQVQQAIEQLTEQQRQILKQRIYEGRKFKDIAAEMKLPLGTVLSRMHSATKHLKSILSSENETDE